MFKSCAVVPKFFPVASLGLLSPGAATDGRHPFFPEQNWRPFFSHRPLQSDDLLSCCLVTTPNFRRHLSTVLSKFSHKKIFFTSGVTPSMVRPSRPPSDVTDSFNQQKHIYSNFLQLHVLECAAGSTDYMHQGNWCLVQTHTSIRLLVISNTCTCHCSRKQS